MANNLYGYSRYGGDTSSNYSSLYSSSAADKYDASSRYLSSDPLSSSAYSSITSDTISGRYSAASKAPWPGPPGVDAAASVDPLTGLKRRFADSLYNQSGFGAYSTIGQSDTWFSANSLAKRPKFGGATSLPIYPQRPGEKDCAHYMLTRTCMYGDSCKFDHPIWVPENGIPDWKEVSPLIVTSETLPERQGEPDCPFFLKTQRCKFGPRCRFNHPKDKIAPLAALENTDMSALPQRPSEPPCAFYTKTGKCKFGATCKFHHPKDIVIPSSGQDFGIEQSEAIKNETTHNFATGNQSFIPASLHNSKGLPIRPGEVDCPFYLKTGSCKYGATCRYNHPDRCAINPPAAGTAFAAAAAAQLNIGVVNPSASILQTIDPRLTRATLGLGQTIYPQRPGQIECDGAINCPYYMKTGACKYGATCKFDHPPPGEVLAATTTQGTSTSTEEQGKEAETSKE